MSKISNETGTAPMPFFVSVIFLVILAILMFLSAKSTKGLGQPITINQLQEKKVYYVNEIIPKLDLMVVSKCNQYPTKDLLTVKGIPDSVIKDCRFIVEDIKERGVDGKIRKIRKVINLY